jgi:hypothetical protein
MELPCAAKGYGDRCGARNRGDEDESVTPQRTGKERPPLIIITSQVNLLQFQKEIKAITKGGFELRNTKKGTRVILREITI